jgi:hypothetical protein
VSENRGEMKHRYPQNPRSLALGRFSIKNAVGEDLHLYRVDVQLTVYCLATDELSAEDAGYHGAREQLSLDDCLVDEVKISDFFDASTLSSLPYGDQATEGELTIQQILPLMREKETAK